MWLCEIGRVDVVKPDLRDLGNIVVVVDAYARSREI
jgi:hypothetical protein